MGFKDYNNNISEQQLKQGSKKVESLYNEYKDKSEDELIKELLSHVAKQKKEGTFNYASLCEMLNQISPFLNEQQKTRMKEILEQLND